MLGVTNLHFQSALWGVCGWELGAATPHRERHTGPSAAPSCRLQARLARDGARSRARSSPATAHAWARLPVKPRSYAGPTLPMRAWRSPSAYPGGAGSGGGREGAGRGWAGGLRKLIRSARPVESPEVAVVNNLSVGFVPFCPPLLFVHPPWVLESVQFQQVLICPRDLRGRLSTFEI